MDRATEWEVAARRYQAKAAGRKLDPKPQKPEPPAGPQSFQEWLDSAEGKAARLLLDAAGEKIFLGLGPIQEGWAHSLYFQATSRSLQLDATEKVSADTGVTSRAFGLTNEAFVKAAMKQHRSWRTEMDLIAFLRVEIERVAEASP